MTETTSGTPLRVGIIGTGGISRAHAPGWVEAGAEIHCFSLEGAEAFAEAYGATVHDSLESLMGAVTVVDICTPTAAHAEQVHAALDAGLDVVCEKPLALTVEEAEGILEHAQKAARTVLPAHVVRYFPQYQAVRRAILAGRIGTPAVLRYERTGAMPKQPWFADEAASGGIIMDQMIHDIDQALWIAGPAESVYAQQSISSDSDAVRTAHVVLTHRSGAISHCRGLWGPAGTAFRYTFSLAGDGGRLEYDSSKETGIEFDAVAQGRRSSGDGFLPDVSTMRSPYTVEIEDFIRALRGEGDADVTCEDGVEAVRIARAALESLTTGRRIAC